LGTFGLRGEVWKIALNRAVAAASYSGHNIKGLSPSLIGLGIAGASTYSLVIAVGRLPLVLVRLFLVPGNVREDCWEGYPEYDGEIHPWSKTGIEATSVDKVAAECCSVWSGSHKGSQLTAPAARLSKSRGVGRTGELAPKDETDVGDDGYNTEPESVGMAVQVSRRYQGLRRPELPLASGGPVVSGPLPLSRLALSVFVFDGIRDSELGDFVTLDEEGGNDGIERGVGICRYLSRTRSLRMNG
jgi:hypothetical protein